MNRLIQSAVFFVFVCTLMAARFPVEGNGGGMPRPTAVGKARTANRGAIQVTRQTITRTMVPGNYCAAVTPESNFLTSDPLVYILFDYDGATGGERGLVEWVNPAGERYSASTFTSDPGDWCYGYYISIAGWPPASLPGQWTVKVFFNDQLTITQTFLISAPTPSPITITSSSLLPAGTVGANYDHALTASGGTGHNWALASGTLPPGLSISSAGRVTGSPTRQGSYRFELSVSNAAGATLRRTFAMGVGAPNLSFGAPSLSFTQISNTDTPPAQTVAVTSTGSALPFTASAESEGNWLSVASSGGTTPATLTVSVNTARVTPGRQQGRIVLRSAQITGDRYLPVTLTVEDPGRPILTRGLISTFAGNDWLFPSRGQAKDAPLSSEAAIAAAPDGSILIADRDNNVVIRYRPNNTFEIVAGNGLAGYSGDGGLATNASLDRPWAVAAGPTGAIFISDLNNDRVRIVTPDGIISTYAGTGRAAFSGDGGPAVSAAITSPGYITTDSAGNVYFEDSGNYRIRMVDGGGTIRTIAGNGTEAEITGAGTATQVPIAALSGIAAGRSGEVYFSVWDPGRIFRVKDGAISVFAGDGEYRTAGDGGPALAASFRGAAGLAIDSGGNLHVADVGSYRVRKIDANGVISTVVGSTYGNGGDGGPATSAQLRFPRGIAFDPQGNLFVWDEASFVIRRVDTSQTISTVMGNGQFRNIPGDAPAAQAFLFFPRGMAFDSRGNLYVADAGGNRIERITPAGVVSVYAGVGAAGCCEDGGPPLQALLATPLAVAVDGGGNLYIADMDNDRIRRIDAAGRTITTVAGNGERGFTGDNGPATRAALDQPWALAIDSAGLLYVADSGNQRIRKITPDGTITTFAGGAEQGKGVETGPATQASFSGPVSLALDSKGNLYVADYHNHRIRRITPAGIISTFAGRGTRGSSGDGGAATVALLDLPSAVGVDRSDNVYIAEFNGNRVRRVDAATGNITTIAGTGTSGFSGDGGLSALASLRAPNGGLAVNAAGDLFISDSGNHRIRLVRSEANKPTIRSSPATLSFNSRSLTGQIRVESSFFGLPFSAVARTSSGGDWLAVSTPNGVLPSQITITAATAGLPNGTYSGTVIVTAPNADPGQLSIPVRLEVTSQEAPRLSVETGKLSFSFQEGAVPVTAQITVDNPSSTPVTFAASGGDARWLSLSPSTGSASAGAPALVTVTINPAGLAPGTYSATISISGGASGTVDAVQVPVYATVNRRQRVILISQTGFNFRAVAQGGSVLPNTLSVLNIGEGSMNWTASATTLSGGDWLRIDRTSGTVQTPYSDISNIQVSVEPSSLGPGEYYGKLELRAQGADNSPQVATVVLNVFPGGTRLGPEVRPTAVVFVGPAGSNPGSQRVSIANTEANATSYVSVNQTIPLDTRTWLQHAPATATINPRTPGELVVQADFNGLEEGVRRGVINLLFQDGSTQDVKVLSVVSPAGAGTSKGSANAAGGCTARGLRIAATNMAQTLTARVGQPVPVEVQVFDDCGQALTRSGTVQR